MVKKTSADEKKKMSAAAYRAARSDGAASARAEDRRRLLKIYHTRKEPFNIKELTKAAKAAGLNEKLVPDINASLMDDNYVQSDKIGSGNYFWSFPGAQGAQAKKQVDEAKARLAKAQARLAAAKEAEATAKAGREDPDGSPSAWECRLDARRGSRS